ncbi:MAG: cation-transporting P-type ATPase [Gemmatimonadaceae bacterium]|nr:cation-transporting P-type ATPase [Gemmatimonadaceae bacterium]
MSTPLATTTERPAALTAGPAWHAEPVALALAAHDVEAARGLATDDATRRRARHGANVLTRRRGPGPATLLLAQFRAPLVLILLGSTRR